MAATSAIGKLTGSALTGAIAGFGVAGVISGALAGISYGRDMKNEIANMERVVASGGDVNDSKVHRKIMEKVIAPLMYETNPQTGETQKITAESRIARMSAQADALERMLNDIDQDPSLLDNPQKLAEFRALADSAHALAEDSKYRIVAGANEHKPLMVLNTDASKVENASVKSQASLDVLLQADRIESLCAKLYQHSDKFRDHDTELHDLQDAEQIALKSLIGGDVETPDGVKHVKGVIPLSNRNQGRIILGQAIKQATIIGAVSGVASAIASGVGGQIKAEFDPNKVSIAEAIRGKSLFNENNANAEDTILTNLVRKTGVLPKEYLPKPDDEVLTKKFNSESEAKEWLNKNGGGSNPKEIPGEPVYEEMGTSTDLAEQQGEILDAPKDYFVNGTNVPDGQELGYEVDSNGNPRLNMGLFKGLSTSATGETADLTALAEQQKFTLLAYLGDSDKPVEIPGSAIRDSAGNIIDYTFNGDSNVMDALRSGDYRLVQVASAGLDGGGKKQIFASFLNNNITEGKTYGRMVPGPSTWEATVIKEGVE